MGCFDNIVGIRGGCTTPTSGILINKIGVSLDELNNIVTADYENGEALFDEKLEYAIITIQNDIHTAFSPKYKHNSVLKMGTLGDTADNLKADPGAVDKLRGIRITACNVNSFIDLHISSITLFTDRTGDIPVFVIDLKQGIVIDTITVAGIANQKVRLDINKTYKTNRKELDLVFAYDTENIIAIRTTIDRHGCTDCGGVRSKKINRHIEAIGAELDDTLPKIDSNVNSLATTAGMCLDYSIQCNHEEWLCGFKNLLALSIAQLTAAMLMEFGMLASDRENSATILDLDKLQQRADLYMMQYEKSFANVLRNIKPPDDRECYECNRAQRTIAQAM